MSKVKEVATIRAGGIKLTAFKVEDPGNGEWSTVQFHMIYGDTIMALMGEEAAKLFSRFVIDTLELEDATA